MTIEPNIERVVFKAPTALREAAEKQAAYEYLTLSAWSWGRMKTATRLRAASSSRSR
jgi:hypothetical protein